MGDVASEPGGEELRHSLWPQPGEVPRRVVRCRHCGTRNRVGVPEAVFQSGDFVCADCGGALFLGPEQPYELLSSESYQHPLDRRSLAALRSIPGLPAAVRWLLERFGDRSAQLMFMSEAILCDEQQFPELVSLVERARSRLDLPRRPTVYLGESPHMNALTTGVGAPVIVIRSALLDQMDDDELLAILGHEIGHLQSDHPLYQSLAQSIVMASTTTSEAIRLVAWPLQLALLRWSRHAEFTADRAALLASRDLRACLEMMFVLAGGNRPGTAGRTKMQLGHFVEQCRELRRMESRQNFDRWIGGYMSLGRTHPQLARRVTQLVQWVEHGNYLSILAGDYLRCEPRSVAPAELKPKPDGGPKVQGDDEPATQSDDGLGVQPENGASERREP